MKKLFLLALFAFIISGCGTAAERSEFWQHDSMYRNLDHLSYSWSGYRNPNQDTLKMTKDQDWWGIPTPE